MKKTLCAVLAALLLLSLAACGKGAAPAPEEPITMPETPTPDNTPAPTAEPPAPTPPSAELSGTCGEGLSWEFNTDTLTIRGQGAMDDYESFATPWDEQDASIRVKSVTVEEGVTYLGANTFASCCNLTAVKLPASLEGIGPNAFADCVALSAITLPAGLLHIDEFAFMGAGLRTIELPENLPVIGANAFSLCVDMKSAVLPARLSSLGEGCFGGCESLESIRCVGGSLAETVLRGEGYGDKLTLTQAVGEGAWSGKTGALSWTLGGGVLRISGSGAIPDYAASGGKAAPWYVLSGLITKIEIDPGITAIGDYAFWCCANAAMVTIPEGVTRIGECGVGGCDAIKTVALPATLRELENGAFSACGALTDVTLPEGLESIGQDAFQFCTALTALTIPASVTKIGDGAFDEATALTAPAGSYAAGWIKQR